MNQVDLLNGAKTASILGNEVTYVAFKSKIEKRIKTIILKKSFVFKIICYDIFKYLI